MTVTVLFIDDDPFMLKALLRTARRLEPGWQLLSCEQPLQWQSQLAEAAPDLVFCDYLMPGCRGDQLLLQVRAHYPQAVRILLTGDTTEEVVQSASLSAHFVLGKPFSEADLQAVFHSWRQLMALPLPAALRAQLCSELQLPPLPAIVRALRRLLRAEQVDLAKVAALLAHEPVIPARLLQLANSALLGFQRPTHSMTECLLRLGTHLVDAVVTLMALDHTFTVDALAQRQLNERAFKKAVVSRTLAQAAGLSNETQEQLFVASLLSAIGPLTQLALSHQHIVLPATMAGVRTSTVLNWFLLTLWGYQQELVQLLLRSDSADYLHHGDAVLALALAGHISQGASRDYLQQIAQMLPDGGLRQCLLHWPL